MSQQETTVRVRILVAVDDTGKWVSAGHFGENDPKDWIILDDLSEQISYRWIEADVPIPMELTLQGSVIDDE